MSFLRDVLGEAFKDMQSASDKAHKERDNREEVAIEKQPVKSLDGGVGAVAGGPLALTPLERIEAQHKGAHVCTNHCTITPEKPCAVLLMARALEEARGHFEFAMTFERLPAGQRALLRLWRDEAERTLREVAGEKP